MSFSPDLTACAQIVERGDPDRFAATMAAPVAARAKLFPIYAFNVEVARAPWLTQESMIAEMRLQWWRDVLEEIRSGGPVRRHEVATPLSDVLSAQSAERLDALIETRRWDIYRDPFEDMDHFRAHIIKTAGHLLLASADSLGDAPEDAILKAGYALGLANWLRAVPALENAGRIPLVEGTPDAVRALAQEGLDALAAARRVQIPSSVRPALLSLWQTGPLLRQARSDPARVANGALGLSPAQARVRLIFATATGRW